MELAADVLAACFKAANVSAVSLMPAYAKAEKARIAAPKSLVINSIRPQIPSENRNGARALQRQGATPCPLPVAYRRAVVYRPIHAPTTSDPCASHT